MHFGNPQLLWLLLAWPLLAALGLMALGWRERVARLIGHAPLLERLYPASIRRWRRQRFVLMMLAALFLIVAAARPQYGRIEQTIRSLGTNVIVALDCSGSMRSKDRGLPASRMALAKQSLDYLLRNLDGDRVGIVAFAGAAVLQCPMTLDRSMALLVLQSLDTDSINVPGTDLGAAIQIATNAFANGADEGGRTLVLITDGEDNEGRGLDAAKAAALKRVTIYALGIGTPEGAPVLKDDGLFHEDSSGKKINTRMHMDTLRAIAQAAGGEAWEAGGVPLSAIHAVAQKIDDQKKTELEARRQILYQDRFQWFLAPALLLLLWLLILRPEPTRLDRAPSASEIS